jgi:hypothetical protein
MAYLRLTISDVLSVWDDLIEDYVFQPDAASAFIAWYRLPDNWLVNGTLMTERRDLLLQQLYGESWQAGNADGSRYRPLAIDEHLLDAAEIASRPWQHTNDPCYTLDATGTLVQVQPSQL